MDTVTPVHAAGGVVWRPRAAGGVRVCVVHRPRYADWTLPKGKLEPDEHPLLAAVREVAEETGVCAVPQVRLPSIRYRTRDDLPKVVDFWSMRAAAVGEFQPNDEVAAVRWVGVAEAAGLLTYPHDLAVLSAFAGLPEVTNVLGLVRHALAGRRSTWSGPDSARPLDADGRARARELAPLLALPRPRRLLAASVRRCVQTLDPLAGRLDLPIEVDSCFDEPAPGRDGVEGALASAARLVELARDGDPAVVCSQGKVIPAALACLAAEATGSRPSRPELPAGPATGPEPDWRTPKGGGWLLAFHGARLVAADRL